jgi:uncharacterized membrane protein YbjE (DUF340 family)
LIKYILIALGLGGLAGYLNSVSGNTAAEGFVSDFLFNASLMLLLFVMGLMFGMDKESLAKLKKTGPKVLVVPFVVALGSILGGLVGGLILGINVVVSMAICAGYGWYTLTGPLIVQIFGTEYGMLGFSVNFLRELLTITTISLMIRIDRYAPIAIGGATTMDTTLPVIVRYCGSDSLVSAFSNGFVLSVAAPFTIVAIASLR